MGGRYHEVASVYHAVKAATYAKVGRSEKAARHIRRAEWHASFGIPPPPPAKSAAADAKRSDRVRREAEVREFNSKYVRSIEADYEGAVSAIALITDRYVEVANIPNEPKKTGNPTEREFKKIHEYVKAAKESPTPGERFRELKAAHKSGTYEPERDAQAEPSTKTKMGNPLENEPWRVGVNVKAALRSLAKFEGSVRPYCKALGEKSSREGYASSHQLVSGLIERLANEWTKMHVKVEEQVKKITDGNDIKKDGNVIERDAPLRARSHGDAAFSVLSDLLGDVQDGTARLESLRLYFRTYCATSREEQLKAESERNERAQQRVLAYKAADAREE